MSLITELSSDFSRAVRSRGGDYFQEGRVKITTGSDWEVYAKVRGSRTYRVDLAIDGSALIVHCDCQAFETEPCKHLWATILAVEGKGYLRGAGGPLEMVPDFDEELFYGGREINKDDNEGDDDEYDQQPRDAPNVAGGSRSKERLPSWKEQLTALGRSARSPIMEGGEEWPPTRRIIYVIDVQGTLESQHLILDTLLQDLKQNGAWGKPRKQRIPRWQITAFPDASDSQIFAMLAGAREQSDYSYYGYDYQDAYDTAPFRHRLTAPLPQLILPLIARTGRCYLKPRGDSDDLAEIQWEEGEPWRFSIQVHRDDGRPGQYIVEGVLRRGGERCDLSKAVMILQGGLIFTHESAAALDDGGAFHWISILRRAGALTIPENQIGEFMTEVLSETKPPRLDLPEELRYEEIGAKPQPCLTFKQQKKNARLRARLSFDYAPDSRSCLIDKDDRRRGVYKFETRSYILRDRNYEAACARRLTEIGLKYVGPNYYEKSGWEIAPTKLPRVVRELVEEGWRVEAEGKVFRGPGEIKVQVSSGIDWFELHSSVDFGETTAKLPELLAALKRGENVIKLDDGTYGMLPEDWLNKYGLLAGLGEAHEEHLRFRKTQVGVLNALLSSQPEADFDEDFARARDELKRFDGVKPAEPPEDFNGELRPYQKDGLGWINFLRQFGFGGCLADDMGLGKCLAADSLILINGELIAAEDIWSRYAQRSFFDGSGDWAEPTTELLTNSISETTGRILETRIRNLYRQRVRENLRRVTLVGGGSITITRRHRLLTEKGWTNDLSQGDYVCAPAKLLWYGEPQDYDLIKFLAWQIAEGYEIASPASLRILQKDVSVLNELRECLTRIGERLGVNLNNSTIHISTDRHMPDLSVYGSEFKRFLESRGYEWGKRSREKSVPPFIMQADDDSVRVFLSNYFDAEASIVDSIRGVEIIAASPKLIQQLSSLLRRFGIWMRVSEKRNPATDDSEIYRYYIGTLGGDEPRKFFREIGFCDPKKQSRLKTICKYQIDTDVEGIPPYDFLVAEAATTVGQPGIGQHNSIYLDSSRQFPHSSSERVTVDGILSDAVEREHCSLKQSKWLGQEVIYCKIKSVEDVEYDGWVYDFEVAEHHNFIANNILCHNTVQVLALLESRRELREETEGQRDSGVSPTPNSSISPSLHTAIPPSLAVVPKSLVFNWKQEAERFAPKLRVLDHTGQTREKASAEHFDDYDLILTTYGTLRNDAILFKDTRFDYVILDEAQAIKNADTASAKAARLLNSDHRLALSGTPIENHLGELWSLFEFLNPGMLGAASAFKTAGGAARNAGAETRQLLAQALRPFILRRTKSQVAKDLPTKQEQTIFCELEPEQRKLYNELRDHYRNMLLDRVARDGIGKSKIQALEALLRLRQAALHPGLIDKKRVKEDSAKLDLLLPQLVELFEEGHKVLVFSQFTSFLSILRQRLDKEKVEYEYLDGSTRDRQARVERFQNDPRCMLFLISLKAGGLGLNLTAAEYVYLLDPWWNPAVESQAIDRAHRIGQTRQVFAYRIIARDTVEEKVLALQNTKRDLADAIINADNSLIRNLSKEDLELLLS
ncbi:MAG: SNF2 helicase associated domain-containing protein [Chloracidobacterium sp.]|nr:SNF2 helicase associated domain-containing protein [Chloracidobacterium sp.]